MIKALRYIWYVIKHKWFVFLECCKLGIPFRGLIHDWSKFTITELKGYIKKFGNSIYDGRNKDGSYDPTNSGIPEFDRAWLHHVRYNKHHWQYWAIPRDWQNYRSDIPHKLIPIPKKYLKEMIADWRGAGREKKTDTITWYANNKDKIMLLQKDREYIEKLLENKYLNLNDLYGEMLQTEINIEKMKKYIKPNVKYKDIDFEKITENTKKFIESEEFKMSTKE